MILDGYELYLTYKFYKYTQKYYIELFQLSSYFIYLIQSFNIGFFQSFKYYYTKKIDNAIRLSKRNFGKLEFLAKFYTMHIKTFRKFIIQLGFKKIRLIFYNLEVIL